MSAMPCAQACRGTTGGDIVAWHTPNGGWRSPAEASIMKGLGRAGRQYVARLLVFGRFLNLHLTGASMEPLPKNLSEWKFRCYWERTDKAGKDPETAE
jgi:hypothetical protein